MSELPELLPAKSAPRGRPPEEALGLGQHLLDTETAACSLFGTGVRWARSWSRFFRLDDPERFLLNLRVACLFHDIGKANRDFVDAVRGTLRRRRERQRIRHEHLSAFVLCLPQVRTWLATSTALDVDVITAAVLSHHLKASPNKTHEHRYWGGASVPHYLQHADVRATLVHIASVADLPAPPELPRDPWGKGDWVKHLGEAWCYANDFGDDCQDDLARRNLSLAVKAALIACDTAASALVREGHPIKTWLASVADRPRILPDDIERHILAPRTGQLGGRFSGYHDFQREIAAQGERVLLLAGCGTGKTLAAYLWAKEVAANRPIGRVVFLYPTRGTATEGFRDYVGWAPETMATLVHATADLELDSMCDNPNEATHGKRYVDETTERLFALKLWPKRYFSATVDQFLGFMVHQYGSLCALPVLADAAVVIDEVHSFDASMFRNLRAFLKAFDVPVLCMTATLPPDRRQQLTDMGLTVYPREGARVAELEAIEGTPRYGVRVADDCDEAFDLAVSRHQEHGERVLWVVNTVDRCIDLARRLELTLKTAVLCYHSRFKLHDRKSRHEAVVGAFQQPDHPAVAVTTQVCEMSLDLDADLLISELAPIASLVQRFGRANRHLKRNRAMVVVYRVPGGAAPYADDELVAASKFIAAVGGPDVSQRMLAAALESHATAEAILSPTARFLESGYFALPGSFRDEGDHTCPAILDEELGDALKNRRRLDEWIVPVPRSELVELEDVRRPSHLPRYLGIAPACNYDTRFGYQRKRGAA